MIRPDQLPALLEKAIAIAVEAHRGARDKYGAPYILHPLRVMHRVQTEPEKIVAILHDVIEDTPWTFNRLRAEGFPDEILAALDCVTKREGRPCRTPCRDWLSARRRIPRGSSPACPNSPAAH